MESFVELFLKGGWVMYPLLALSLMSAVFIIERLFVLRKAKINVNEFLAKLR